MMLCYRKRFPWTAGMPAANTEKIARLQAYNLTNAALVLPCFTVEFRFGLDN